MLFSYQITAIRGGQQVAVAQNVDWHDKKDSVRKETTMLDWLKEILGESWTEEIDKKVSDVAFVLQPLQLRPKVLNL